MISVLYVDDEPNLLDIAKRFLERAGEFRVGISTSAQEALDSHSIQSYDAIVADYQMPGMDGIAFLKVVRERFGDIPFILFTGRGREEVVIEAINNGADFYLQKGGDPKSQFAELAHKIRQAVARRQAEQSLHDSERRLSDIIDFLPDATFAIDRSGHVIAWNRAIEEMTGVPSGDMLGKGNYEYAIPFYGKKRPILIDLIDEPDEKISQFYSNVYRTGNSLTAETDLPRPKGLRISVLAKVCHLYNQAGEIIGAIESIRDITGLKKAEESISHARKDWETIFRAIGHPALVLDGDNRIIDANDATLKATGKSLGDLKGKHCYDVFHKPGECRPPESCPFEQLKKNGSTENVEIEIEALEGYYAVSCTPVYDATGKVEKVIHIAMDITERRRDRDDLTAAYEQIAASEEELRCKYDELARSEQRIRESEEKYRNLAENTADILFSLDRKGTITYISPQIARLGFKPEELVDKGFLSLIHPDDREWIFTTFEGEMTSGVNVASTFRLIDKSGLTHWVEERSNILLDEQKRPRGLQGVVRDITEEKAAQDALREREASLSSIFRAAPIGIGLVSNRILIEVNDRFCEMTGYSREELTGKSARIVYPSDEEFDFVGREKYDQIRKSGTGTVETCWKKKDGTLIDILLSSTLLDPADPAKGVTFTALDITDRKRAENALARSEEQLRTLSDNLPGGSVYQLDMGIDGQQRRFSYMSAGVERLHGVKVADVLNDAMILYGQFVDEDQHLIAGREAFALANMSQFSSEARFRLPSGEIRWSLITSVPHLTSDHHVVWDGIEIDITERKRTEEALRESEEKYRTLVEHSQVGVFIVQDGRLAFYNRAFAEMTGYNEEELIGRLIPELIAPEDREMAMARHQERVSGRLAPESYEFFGLHKDGTSRVRVRLNAGMGTYKGRPATIGTFLNVTEDRKREDALRESEERYRSLVDSSFDGIAIHQDGIVVFVNNTAARLLGSDDPAYFIGKPAINIVHPDDRPQVADRIRQAPVKTQELIQEKFLRVDGNFVDVDVATTPCTWQGKPAAYVTFRDISEQKRVERELRESEERYRSLVEICPDAIILHRNGKVAYMNPAALTLIGASHSDEVIGKNLLSYIHPDYVDALKTNIQKDLAGERTSLMELSMLRLDGTSVIVEGRGTRTFIDGNPAVQVAIRDITERKRVEEALRESEEKFRTIVDTTSEWIWEIDREGHHTYSNPAIASILGYQPEEILSANTFDLIHPEDRESIRELLPSLIKERKGWRNLVIRWRHKDTSYHYLESNAIPVFDHQEEIIGFRGADRDITERTRAEDAVRESEVKYRLIAENTTDSIWIFDMDLNLKYMSPSVKKIRGFTAEEAIHQSLEQMMTPKSRESVIQRFHEEMVLEATGTADPGRTVAFESEEYCKDGSTILMENSAVLLRDADGRPTGILGISRDITERKRAEEALQESEEKYRLLFENAYDAIYLHEVSREGPKKIFAANEAACRMLGYTREEFLRITVADIDVPEQREKIPAILDRLSSEGTAVFETEHLRKDGSRVPVLVSIRTFDLHGTMVMLSIVRDITDRKRAEEALQESEERYRHLFERAPFGIGMATLDGRILASNRLMEIITGFSGEELKVLNLADIYVNPDDRAELFETLKTSGAVVDYPALLKRKDGIEYNASLTIGIVNIAGENVLQTLVQDITDRKRMEAALRESEERYRSLVDSSFDGIAIHQDGIVVFVNNTAARLLGSDDPAYFIGKPAINTVHPDDRPQVADRIRQAPVKTQELIQEKFLRVDGSFVDVDVATTPCTWQGKPAAYVTFRDISGQKRLEAALRESEENFRKIFENSALGMTLALPDSRFLLVNPAWESMLGYTEEEFRKMSFKDITHPDNIAGDIEGIRALAAGTIPVYSTEKRYIRKDGSTLWGALKVTTARNQDGTVRHYIAQIEDITSRKQAEDALRESEERLALIMNGVPTLISYMDPELRFVYLNKSHREWYGLAEKDLIGKSLKELLPEDIFLQSLPYYQQVLSGREVSFENPSRDRNGRERMLNVRLVPHVHGGQVVGFFAALEDITERKRMEEALKESEENFHSMFESHDSIMLLIEPETGKIIDANLAAERFYGRTRTELCTLSMDEINALPPEVVAAARAKAVQGEVTFFTFPHRIASGEIRTVEVHSSPIAMKGKTILFAIIHDITDRRLVEAALRQANRKLNLLSGITRHDMKNQLMVLKSYLDISKGSLADPALTAEFIAKEEMIAETISHQISFTKDYEDMGVKAPVWQNVSALIRRIIARLPMRDIHVEGGDPALEVFADRLLEKVFYNLIDNSLRHGGERMTSIRVTTVKDKRRLVISVEDDGVGISAQDKKHLFTKGFGTHTGLGLYLSREILSITGMTITEKGEPGKGARFEITVPKGAWRRKESGRKID